MIQIFFYQSSHKSCIEILILDRRSGFLQGVWYDPLAVSPLENEHVDRYDTQRLVPKLKVSGQLVTSPVRPGVCRRGRSLVLFGLVWFIIPLKLTVKSKFKQHRITHIKPRRIMHFLFGQSQG